MRRRLWVAGAVLVAFALAVGGLLWWRGHDDRTSLAWAVGHAPAGTQRASWTDWAAVRAHEGAHLSVRSSTGDLRRFLTKAFDEDLSSASALVGSAPVLQQRFGFSPANVEWELFSQSEQGAVVMLRLPSADLDSVPDHLRALGYQEPADVGGVWNGGSDLVAGLSPDLTPELSHVAVDSGSSLVLASDSAAFLSVALQAVHGDGPRVTGLDAVVDDAGEPLSSAVYTGDYACGALAMAHAGVADQAEGRRLLAAAGEVDPYSAFATSVEPDGSVRVALEFECRVRSGGLTLTAAAHTDLFVDPAGVDQVPDAGRFTGLPQAGDFTLAAQVSVEFASMYDAGVLLLHAAGRDWAKLCFEYSPQLKPTAVTVVTRGTSDDCNSFEVDGNTLWLRITRSGAAWAFHASTDGAWWRLLRYFTLGKDLVRVGFLAQSQAGAGCAATFDHITFRAGAPGNLRDGS